MSFITRLQHSFSGKEERPCYITYVTCPFATWVVEKEREKIEQKKREKIEQKKREKIEQKKREKIGNYPLPETVV